MTARTDATAPLAAAVKGARSIGLPSANVSVHALEAAIAENGELRKRVELLTAHGAESERRPHRAMYADGPEITVIGTPLGPDRPVRHTLRQVGWIGQTGAFYDLDENPRPTEPGSYAPLYFMAHSDEYDAADTTPQPPVEPVHFTTNGGASVCGRRASSLPKGVAFTLAFDPDDDTIDCPGCGLYLRGLRAASTTAGSPR